VAENVDEEAVKEEEEQGEIKADEAAPTIKQEPSHSQADVDALKADHAVEVGKLQSELNEARASVKSAVDEAVKVAVSKERTEQIARLQGIIASNVEKRLKPEVEKARAAAVEELQVSHAAALKELQDKLESTQKEAQSRLDLNSKANKAWKDSVTNLRKHIITCNELLIQAGVPVPPDIAKEAQRAITLAARAEAQNGAAAAPAAGTPGAVPPVAPASTGLSIAGAATPGLSIPQGPAGLPARPTIASPVTPAQVAPGGQQAGPVRFTRPTRASPAGPFGAALAAVAPQPGVPANGLKRGREGEEGDAATGQPIQAVDQGPAEKKQRFTRQTRQSMQQG
jgi:hypothetical protein